jgi:hypothetical protein
MSTQLIVYPQNYEGFSSSFSGVSSQFIVDGINFSTINSSASCDSTSSAGGNIVVLECMTAENVSSGIVVNTWYRFRSTSPTPTLPTRVSNNLVLYSAATASVSGVYQRLDNLIVGASYSITINHSAFPVGSSLNCSTWSGIHPQPITFNSTSFNVFTGTQITFTFVATSTQNIISLQLKGVLDDDVTIEDISITSTVISPSGVYTDLVDGQVICDLYEEEDIPLTLSMDEFKNVAEQVKSYSKDFNLPATKRNNQIFDNIFEVTRADDGRIFNPQVATKCVLKQDGFIVFEGFIRLIDIKEKDGEISYNVNLYSEVVALAEVLGDRTFGELDFTELEHSYTITNIQDSWESIGSGQGLTLTNPLPTTSLAFDSVTGFNNTQVLKYPFVDWNHQYTGFVNPTLVNLESSFRPFIQLKYLINKIFKASNQFTYTSAFFDSAEFEKLFMDFNWGGNEQGASPTVIGANNREPNSSLTLASPGFESVSYNTSISGDNTYWSTGLNRFTSPVNNLNFTCILGVIRARCVTIAGTITMRFAHYDSNNNFIQEFGLDTKTVAATVVAKISTSFSTVMAAGDYIQAETKVGLGTFDLQTDSKFNMLWSSFGSQTSTLLTEIRGELGQWEFLKGIMTMFNLVSTADKDNPNNILIEPYADLFFENTNGGAGNLTLAARSIEHDWTDKVDVSQMELETLTDLEKITTFQFAEDDEDYVFGVYKQAQNGHLYGSQSYDASLSSSNLNTIFRGTKEISAEPFAASVVAPLMSQLLDFVVPRIYTKDEDGVTTSFANSPRILYNNGLKTLNGNAYTVPPQNGDTAATLTGFLQFSHLSDIPSSLTSTDYYFNSHQLPSSNVGVPPIDNLFYTYWLPYLSELYNADTRTMTLRVNLSSSDIANFKFYDTVFIKNRSFRVNYIDYKPNSLAKVEFILLP